jgi:hypothetical protein
MNSAANFIQRCIGGFGLISPVPLEDCFCGKLLVLRICWEMHEIHSCSAKIARGARWRASVVEIGWQWFHQRNVVAARFNKAGYLETPKISTTIFIFAATIMATSY